MKKKREKNTQSRKSTKTEQTKSRKAEEQISEQEKNKKTPLKAYQRKQLQVWN